MTDEVYVERRGKVLEALSAMIRTRFDKPTGADAEDWTFVVHQEPPIGEPAVRWTGRREQNAWQALRMPADDRQRAHAEALFSGKAELTDELIDTLAAIRSSGPTTPMPIKAVAFDAFGTLVTIVDKFAPYATLLRMGGAGPAPSPMTAAMDLATTAELAGIALAPDILADLEAELAAELSSVVPFLETLSVLDAVRSAGLKVAVASNLALPYDAPLKAILDGRVDEWCLSYDMNTVKPDPAFYAALCDRLGCAPGEVLMVGDTWRCDYAGAALAGLQALHLDRRDNATPGQAPVSISDLSGVLNRLDGTRPALSWFEANR